MLQRQWFYFGSFAASAYLASPEERVFSPGILILNLLAIMCALLLLAWTVLPGIKKTMVLQKGMALLIPATFAVLVWGQGTIVIPESRFIIVTQVVVWIFALQSIYLVARLLRPQISPKNSYIVRGPL